MANVDQHDDLTSSNSAPALPRLDRATEAVPGAGSSLDCYSARTQRCTRVSTATPPQPVLAKRRTVSGSLDELMRIVERQPQKVNDDAATSAGVGTAVLPLVLRGSGFGQA